MTNVAPVKWAQRSDSIYVTICLPDVTDEKIDLGEDSLDFKYVLQREEARGREGRREGGREGVWGSRSEIVGVG